MEYFRSGGGNNSPYFSHRIRVPDCTSDMYTWCTEYDDQGSYFRRWHVEWKGITKKNYDVVQFEWEEAALLFALKFGCL